jgi:tetratricopeptide (TPR) repeat protein
MRAYRIVCDCLSQIPTLRHREHLPPVLAAMLFCACQGALYGAADGTTLPSQPAPPPSASDSSHWQPKGDWKTQEDHDLPQQWGRAYGEGLRQGYEAGRLFPRQLDEAYRQGLYDGYRAWQYYDEDYQRAQRLYRTRDEANKAGLEAFRQASYDQAVDLFVLATQLDNGDPASRLYAAQALFAVGQYEQAIPLLRRAFELQPNLLYLRFDLRLDYGNPEDLTAQLQDLQAVVAANPSWTGGHLLLGYQLLHSGQRDQAHQAFTRAARLDPVDPLARKFLKVSYPVPARPAPKAAAPAAPPGPVWRPRSAPTPTPAPVAPTGGQKA